MIIETSLATTALAGIVWAVRQEGRISLHERLLVERERSADERHGELKERLERIEAAVERLRRGQ